jgi:hypothetical protein
MRRSAGFGLNLPCLTPIPSHFLEHVRMRTPFDGAWDQANRWTPHYQFRRAVERVGTGTGKMRKSVSAATRESLAMLYRSKAEPAGQPYMDESRPVDSRERQLSGVSYHFF